MQPTVPKAMDAPRLMPDVGLTDERSSLEAGLPIARLAAVVRNGQYSDAGVRFKIDDVVREASDRHCSHWQVGRHARHRGSGTRQVMSPRG